MEFWLDFWAIATVCISIIGIASAGDRILLFRTQKDELSGRLVLLFMTDLLIYSATAAFGIFNFVQLDADWLMYPARALFLLANIWFAWQLVKPIKAGK